MLSLMRSAQISRLFCKAYLSHCFQPRYIIYNNGSECKLHFELLCDKFGIDGNPTTTKNPQADSY